MASSSSSKLTAAVTGASGYIGSHVVCRLTAHAAFGEVRGTVRSLEQKEKFAHLPKECKLFEADLRGGPEAFADVFAGVDVVFHVASPFFTVSTTEGVEEARERLVQPAVEGTENVLRAAAESASVKRVVLTSSMAAVCGNQREADPAHVYDENDWNNDCGLGPDKSAYAYSKTKAEEAAWALLHDGGELAGSGLELAVINPSFVFGPPVSATRRDATSIKFMLGLLDGQHRDGAPASRFGVVDVRDVAEAHVRAALVPDAAGKRFIVSQEAQSSPLEMAKLIKAATGERFADKLPTKELGERAPPLAHSSNNSRACELLGVQFTPFAQTIKDMLESGLV